MDRCFWVQVVIAVAACLSVACSNPLGIDFSKPAPTPAEATVAINASSFDPLFLFLRPGGQLTFENKDGVGHQIVSSQCSVFNTAPIGPGRRISIQMPPSAMTCDFQDAENPSMTGTIQVCSEIEGLFGPCR